MPDMTDPIQPPKEPELVSPEQGDEELPTIDLARGIRTTEFWVAVALFGAGLYIDVQHQNDLVGGGLMALSAAIYAPFRALIKSRWITALSAGKKK